MGVWVVGERSGRSLHSTSIHLFLFLVSVLLVALSFSCRSRHSDSLCFTQTEGPLLKSLTHLVSGIWCLICVPKEGGVPKYHHVFIFILNVALFLRETCSTVVHSFQSLVLIFNSMDCLQNQDLFPKLFIIPSFFIFSVCSLMCLFCLFYQLGNVFSAISYNENPSE